MEPDVKYYYLGLEASVRNDNRYWDICEAQRIASFCSKRLNLPIRIFAMTANNHSKLVQIISPDEAPYFEIDKVYSL